MEKDYIEKRSELISWPSGPKQLSEAQKIYIFIYREMKIERKKKSACKRDSMKSDERMKFRVFIFFSFIVSLTHAKLSKHFNKTFSESARQG